MGVFLEATRSAGRDHAVGVPDVDVIVAGDGDGRDGPLAFTIVLENSTSGRSIRTRFIVFLLQGL